MMIAAIYHGSDVPGYQDSRPLTLEEFKWIPSMFHDMEIRMAELAEKGFVSPTFLIPLMHIMIRFLLLQYIIVLILCYFTSLILTGTK